MTGSNPSESTDVPPERRSKSAEAARQLQIARELAMTPLERMLLALRLAVIAQGVAKSIRGP